MNDYNRLHFAKYGEPLQRSEPLEKAPRREKKSTEADKWVGKAMQKVAPESLGDCVSHSERNQTPTE